MKLTRILRISLYQFWLEAVSVLMLGTLNRVLRMEIGPELAQVGLHDRGHKAVPAGGRR